MISCYERLSTPQRLYCIALMGPYNAYFVGCFYWITMPLYHADRFSPLHLQVTNGTSAQPLASHQAECGGVSSKVVVEKMNAPLELMTTCICHQLLDFVFHHRYALFWPFGGKARGGVKNGGLPYSRTFRVSRRHKGAIRLV